MKFGSIEVIPIKNKSIYYPSTEKKTFRYMVQRAKRKLYDGFRIFVGFSCKGKTKVKKS